MFFRKAFNVFTAMTGSNCNSVVNAMDFYSGDLQSIPG